MFFKGRISQEDGYVLQVRKNALQVLVPKYGLEATLFLEGKHVDPQVKFSYDETVSASLTFFSCFNSLEALNNEHYTFPACVREKASNE
jgi:hypothetical protein